MRGIWNWNFLILFSLKLRHVSSLGSFGVRNPGHLEHTCTCKTLKLTRFAFPSHWFRRIVTKGNTKFAYNDLVFTSITRNSAVRATQKTVLTDLQTLLSVLVISLDPERSLLWMIGRNSRLERKLIHPNLLCETPELH